MRCLIALVALSSAAPALALVEPEQSLPERPLVIDEGELDLYGGLHLALITNPELDIADMVHIPLGAYYGLGDNIDVGLHVDTTFRPTFTMAFTPRARIAFGESRMLAVGLAMTLPFGFATYRLGPRGLPLRLELPVFRYERSAAGVQASVGWRWTFQEGTDTKGLDANIAGILGIGTSAFALIDVGLDLSQAPDPVTGESGADARLEAGLGVGWRITHRIILKAEVFSHDFVEFQDIQFLVLLVHRWLPERQTSADDWL